MSYEGSLICSVFCSAWWVGRDTSSPLCEFQAPFSNPLVILSPASVVSSHTCTDQQAEYSWGPFVQPFPLWHVILQTVAAVVSPEPQFHFFYARVFLDSSWVLSPCAEPGNARCRLPGQPQGSSHLFPIFQQSLSLVAWYPGFEIYCFVHFVWVSVVAYGR